MRISFIPIAVFIFLFVSCHLSAQVREDLLPHSFSMPASGLNDPSTEHMSFDPATAKMLDTRDDKKGYMPKFARAISTDISLSLSGSWTTLDGGDRIWLCHVSSPGALALIPCFDQFYLPQGATLHIYTPDRKEVLGAFTADNNPADGRYNTGLIYGADCILEYYEPAAVAGQGIIHLNEVGHAYRMVPQHRSSSDFGDADACEVNVACAEGAAWVNEKNAVVRLLVKLGGEYGWCTGTLMNNTAQDCKPYILSADHCYQNSNDNNTPATAADLSQWVFYFNYQSPTCANPLAEGILGTHGLTGCTLASASLDNGGDNGSDYVLIRMNTTPPAAYSPYYAGWSRSNAASPSGVSIHHPNGDIKKISTYTSPVSSSHWGTLTLNTHWEVQWDGTANGNGVTEPGSSGAPIFDNNHRVIGHLTGGGSGCNDLQESDLFGKVAYDWTGNSTAASRRLSTHLDPISTGAQTLNGTSGNCATTGVRDMKTMLAITVYPNPSTGIYTLTNTSDVTDISITDALGRRVADYSPEKKPAQQIDISAEDSGIYILHISSSEGVTTRKVVLNKKH